ncbi:acyl-CoA synthetase [Peribacillus cavernae]|uniref:Acyl-CoA synthetase n=1 Tax=Peribacillus cavernae TaxID=1674310 RepID=A0A3S0UBL2_9BACI|nr:AMP-binding protein [Peribacillus cavernae]MDQ0219411.1 long-chain acyl-CoA synthetase [Peribacillus cavernae]RUQ27716.1 acyl-CoA synthetase [Peribacillus cavernae]
MTAIISAYRNNAEQYPEKLAIKTRDQELNYREWHELISKTANWIDSLGSTNKTVGMLLPNGIPFLQFFAAASAAGWVAVPLDLKWKETELKKRLALCSPSIVITTRDLYDKLKPIYSNVMIFEECLEEINQTLFTQIKDPEGDRPFYMGFTSGSTGEPKAFIRSQESWVESFNCTRFDFHIDEAEHVLIPGALIHSHFLYGAISTFYLGGTVYLLEKFSPNQTLSWLLSQPISVVYVVPTMVEALLKEKSTVEKSVKMISSGAKWEENSKLRIREMFLNLSMYEFYGASELSFVTALSDQENKRKPGSVGRPCHNVEIQIRLSNGDIAKTNEVGKIYVRSRMVFIGYLHANDLTIHSLEDKNGWSTVDDIGYMDEDGFLYIAGREKNMILYGGINIFPEEIETVLSLHPDVEAVSIVGVPDPYWGQIAAAVVKGKASKGELRRFCKMKLASYKVPRKWYFVDELPLTTGGKIARAQIKEFVESKVNVH